VLFSFAFGIKALLSAISFARLNRDLREGHKRFIDAQVEAQDLVVPSGGGDSSAYTFWIRAAGRKIVVAAAKYDGKTFLFSGTIASIPYRLAEVMILPLQKAAGSQSKGNVIDAYFPLSYTERIERLSVGQQVNLRCRVDVYKETKEFALLGGCQLE
jgi:hypothetical protein